MDNNQLVEDQAKAFDLATTENRVREVLGANVEGETDKVARVAEFLTEFAGCTKNWRWDNKTLRTPDQYQALGSFVADIAVMSERGNSNAFVIYKLFSGSDLFKPFYMLGRDIRFAKEIATEKINAQLPDGNYKAYDVMDEIFEYLSENKPEA